MRERQSAGSALLDRVAIRPAGYSSSSKLSLDSGS